MNLRAKPRLIERKEEKTKNYSDGKHSSYMTDEDFRDVMTTTAIDSS
jgi:hypothetical protein